MEGHGEYNRSSKVQAAGLSTAIPLFLNATAAVELPSDLGPIVIADYGSSQGGNSLEPIAHAIQALRQRIEPRRPVTVFHTDLPDNDFSALFRALENDPRSYLNNSTDIFPAAIGRSFYEQILPPNSVTLGWSSWAVQWLSRTPISIPDQVQVAYSRDTETKAAFAAQAASDWRAFLTHRGAELQPDGRLIVLTMALDDSESFGYGPVLDAMYGTLLDMVERGFLARDEVVRMTIPTVARSRSDFLAPFQASSNGQFAELSVEHLEIFQGEDRIWNQYQKDVNAEKFGAQWAAFSRASVFPTLAADLRGGPTDPRAEEFVSRLEAGMVRKLATAPTRMVIPLAEIVLCKGRPFHRDNPATRHQ
ncbi:MAG: SAM-dependent methyltransferase [Verrucomicrobia bacterium]|nr:SAM-dependent methyltransferase [Verrucomicrobiota bacterium]